MKQLQYSMDDQQTLLISGVEDIGVILRETSLSVSEIFETISSEMAKLQGDSILLGEVSTGLMAKFSTFQEEFPHFIREIENYSDFMMETLKSLLLNYNSVVAIPGCQLDYI